MGNDAVGLRVMDHLRQTAPRIDCVEGGIGGMGLIPLMEGFDRIIIVDAMTGFGKRGDVQVFRSPPPSHLFPLSLHDIGIVETLAVARELGIATDVIIVGIEGGAIEEFSDQLDDAVRRAIPVAARIVLDEIQKE
jgi:hydrogenase maturation protease